MWVKQYKLVRRDADGVEGYAFDKWIWIEKKS